MTDQKLRDLLRSAHFEGCTEILVTNDVREFLRTAPMRAVKPPTDRWGLGYTTPEILHEGAWKDLCRTDLMDDVATGSCKNLTAEEWREHYQSGLDRAYGIRYDGRRYSIIDQLTDG